MGSAGKPSAKATPTTAEALFLGERFDFQISDPTPRVAISVFRFIAIGASLRDLPRVLRKLPRGQNYD
jgi:hypothetical protein